MQKDYKLDIWDIFFTCLYGLLFTHIILGIEKINPFYTNWLLLPGSDYSYHYLAWEYFKDTPWSWPAGRIEGYAYPMYNSVMYTDSIPLLAFFFKLFRNILPPDFQYFGIWYCLCYILNGYFGICIARRIGYARIASWLVSVFFTGAVVLVARFGHAALCGQWLLLWCLNIYISRKNWSQMKIHRSIFFVVVLSSLIHPYLLFMVLGLITFTLLQFCQEKRMTLKIIALQLLSLIGISLFSWYSSGAFLFKGQLSEGLGKFAANLNTFINAWDVGALGPSFNYFDAGQGEGIGYLGLAIIILFLVLVILQFVYKRIKIYQLSKNYFLLACILFFIFSLSPKWTLGKYLLIDWQYKDYISLTFRGTGRFIWPLYYYILYWTFNQLYHAINEKRQLIGILLITLVIQASDLRPIWIRNKYVDLTPGPLPYENEMKAIISKADKVIVYPPYAASISDFSDYIYFVNFAQYFKKPITTGYGARFPKHIGSQFRDSVSDLTAYIQKHPNDVILTNIDSLTLHKRLLSNLGGRTFQFERYRMYLPDDLLLKINFDIDSNSYLSINTQVDTAFTDLVLLNKGNYIFGVVQEEGLGKLSAVTKDSLSSFKSKVDSIGFGDSWLFGIYHNSMITEKYSKSDLVMDSINIRDIGIIHLMSGGHNSGHPMSSIKFKNVEYSMQKRGINLLILDTLGAVRGHLNFDSYISDRFFSK